MLDADRLYDSAVMVRESWLMKVEYKVKLDRSEITMIRWIFGST